VARTFGPAFAVELGSLEPGRWSGPVDSAYGHHLVLVEDRTEGSLPDFEEIRPALVRDLESERRGKANEKLYESLRSRYEVVLDEDILIPQVAAVGNEVKESP